jgi:membrane-associated HD superfamily phosphohydrolase
MLVDYHNGVMMVMMMVMFLMMMMMMYIMMMHDEDSDDDDTLLLLIVHSMTLFDLFVQHFSGLTLTSADTVILFGTCLHFSFFIFQLFNNFL